MIPRQLTLRNFLCYREGNPPLDFRPLPIVCLSGENGAGKSSILDAITWALWGQARLRSDDDMVAHHATDMMVDFAFSVDGQEYRVIRRRTRGRRGQTLLDFHVQSPGGWTSLTAGTIRETQQAINAVLRMDYDLFCTSAYLRQGRADAFTRCEPARRKQILGEILGLELYAASEETARGLAREAEQRVRELDGRGQALAPVASRRADAEAELALAEAERRSYLLQLAACEDAERAARAQLEDLERAALDVRRMESLAEDQVRAIGALHVEQQRLQDLVDAQQALLRNRAVIERGMQELATARSRITSLQQEEDRRSALARRQVDLGRVIALAREGALERTRAAEARVALLQQHVARRDHLAAERAAVLAEMPEGGSQHAALVVERDRVDQQIRTRHRLEVQVATAQSTAAVEQDALRTRMLELTSNLEVAERASREAAAQEGRLVAARQAAERHAVVVSDLEDTRVECDRLTAAISTYEASCSSLTAQEAECDRRVALFGEPSARCPVCGGELTNANRLQLYAAAAEEREGVRVRLLAEREALKSACEERDAYRARVVLLDGERSTLGAMVAEVAFLEREHTGARVLAEAMAAITAERDAVQEQLGRADSPAARTGARIAAELRALPSAEELDRQRAALEASIQRDLEWQRARERAAARVTALDERIADLGDVDGDLKLALEALAALRDEQAHLPMVAEERADLEAVERALVVLQDMPRRLAAATHEVAAHEGWEHEARRLAAVVERGEADVLALQECGRQIERLAQAHEQLTAELAMARGKDADREQAHALLGDSRAAVEQARERVTEAEQALGECRASVRAAHEAHEALEACERERGEAARLQGRYNELALAFGKRGVQALLIETALPELEHEANRLLGRMTDQQMQVRFETQRDTKKGDVAETLEISITDPQGTRPYDAFSGGEAFRIDVAIRIALARLLARRNGARLETLIIDEGFGSQDVQGRERLVEVITAIQNEFKQVIVVTHIQELKDVFPALIEVRKTPAGSVWSIV